MLLSARPLKNVASANVFEYANTFEWTSGDTVTVFFQLIFPLDPSIWSFNVLSTDLCTGTANLRLSLNQGGIITQGVLKNAFRVQSTTTI